MPRRTPLPHPLMEYYTPPQPDPPPRLAEQRPSVAATLQDAEIYASYHQLLSNALDAPRGGFWTWCSFPEDPRGYKKGNMLYKQGHVYSHRMTSGLRVLCLESTNGGPGYWKGMVVANAARYLAGAIIDDWSNSHHWLDEGLAAVNESNEIVLEVEGGL